MKKVLGAILVIAAVASFCFLSSKVRENEYNDYCHKVNSLISNEDFDMAKVVASKIVLYTSDGEQLKEISFEEFDKTVKIDCIRKEGTITYFVLSRSLDDESGIMFINDSSNGLLDGVKTLTRIGGNSYRYDTTG